jgi:hypothetical protein
MFRIVAFYTENTPYEDEVVHLEESLKRHGLKYIIYKRSTRGSWVANCAQKPEIILNALTCSSSDVVYLDADAVVDSYPTIFDTIDCDIGVHFLRGKELLSGTLYFKNCPKIMKLVYDWQEAQKKSPDVWDQKILQQVLDDHPEIRISHLPESYIKIKGYKRTKDTATPVIRHNQASRRFKGIINQMGYSEIEVPRGVKRSLEGTFWIPRRNKYLEGWMDDRFVRLSKHQLEWAPKHTGKKVFEDLRPIFEGKPAYIIGKGPSLDHLTPEHFIETDAPIICVNESVHVLNSLDVPNPIFAMQQDARLKDKCKPKNGFMILGNTVANFYADFENKYVYTSNTFPSPGGGLTACVAIKICHFLGTTKINMVSFDAATHQITGYATKMDADISLGGSPARFINHIKSMTRCLGKMPVVWITPEVLSSHPDSEASDTLQPLPDSPVEHHENAHDEP